MMRELTYKLYNTTSKTAKENNLEISGNKLFDFSLLDTLDIPEYEKEVIKETALKYVMFSSKKEFYGKEFNTFEACDGTALYYVTKVYSKKTGALKYGVFTLAKLEHYSKSRKSVYDKFYDIVEYKANNGCNEPISDIEI